ncbi:MAG: DUF1501 domain-containing protein [Longimicrobiales bacterium]
MSGMKRRAFVRNGTLALLALGMPPAFLRTPLLGESTFRTARKKTLICIFQRGAVDGLSMVVPFGEKAYYGSRRSIAVPQPGRTGGAIDLDGFFGLHPSLAPLRDLYGRKELAVIHAVGSPDATRSHFDAQDYMESGTPGAKATRDGWLNRALSHTDCDCGRTLADKNAHAADHAVGQLTVGGVAALRGIAMGTELPRSLRGEHPALAISDLQKFGISGGRDSGLQDTFQRLYHTDGNDAVEGAAGDAFEAIRILKAANPLQYNPASGVSYPASDFGRSLRQIAQLIKSGVGVEVAFADLGGWDTHQAQGGAQGQLARRLDDLARGVRALYDDLGDRMEDVVLITMSEFGRTVRENGSGGTDHGHANCMMVMGGGVHGGRILGDWPGLEREQLYEGRDLALTTDFRDVFAEVTSRHLGTTQLDKVFPGYAVDPRRFRGFLG